MHRYVENFHLNVALSSTVQSTTYQLAEQKWIVQVKTATERHTKTITAKPFVQATGLGGGNPHIPSIGGGREYKGISIHSVRYRNAQLLAEQGVKVRQQVLCKPFQVRRWFRHNL